MSNKLNTQKAAFRLAQLSIFILLFSIHSIAQSSIPDNKYWVTDGDVNAIAKDPVSNTVYIGGLFQNLFKNTPGGVAINRNTGLPKDGYSFPCATGSQGTVNAAVPDGSGGWFIGGSFRYFSSGEARHCLAHLNSSGQPTAWDPDVDATVNAILLVGNTIYVGGSFTSVGGQPRVGLAAIDATTGAVTSWNPNSTGTVLSMGISGNTLYIGGNFFNTGGQPRNNIAAIDVTTGLATSWNPNSDNIVRSIVVSGNTVYAGGQFTSIGGQSRNRIAALNAATGLATSWDPNANGIVRAISLSGNTIYVGGQFDSISGQARSRIASFNVANGLVTSWNPGADDIVNTITPNGNQIYVGGIFGAIGGQPRWRLASFDVFTGLVSSWDPNVYGGVNTVAVSGSLVYAGGTFAGVNRIARSNLAAFDSQGQPTSWGPGANDRVSVLTLNGNTIYAGGSFTSVGGQPRSKLAAININSMLPTSWNPFADGNVLTLATYNGKIYAGGSFTTVGGQTRNRLVSVDSATGTVDSWNPNANSAVTTVVIDNGLLYVGGNFTTVGGLSRNRIAALDINTGIPTSWNPGVNSLIRSIAINASTVYAGGAFTQVGGQSRNRLASIDKTTGVVTSWDPNVTGGNIYSLALDGNTIYAVGDFSTVGGQSRSRAASIDITNGSPTLWNPPFGGNITTIAVSDHIYIGGTFSQFGHVSDGPYGLPQGYIAVFTNCTKAPKTPGAITQTAGAAKICPGETRTFEVASVAGASSYNWSVPTGTAIISGQGTTSVVVSFDGSFPASDTIKVNASNACGISAYKIKLVSKGAAPAKPSVITGDYYGVCGASSKPYSIIDVPGLIYAWSFDNGDASVASGQGTSSITADFAPAYLTGALNVTGTNGCGTSPVRSRTIKALPATPESITGDAVVCAHETGVPYSTPAISGATTYTWKAPTGTHISDGVTTSPLNTLTTTANSVTVNFGTASGDVRVKATNACGYTGNFILPVTVGCSGGRLAGNTTSETTADIVVYPNPASDVVNISFQSKEGTSYSINLYDVLGKEVMVEEGSASEGTNQVELNTSSLASGVYHLVLKGAGIDYNTKLILDK